MRGRARSGLELLRRDDAGADGDRLVDLASRTYRLHERREVGVLHERHGEIYQDYCARTPRWI